MPGRHPPDDIVQKGPTYWDGFLDRWALLTPPLRPSPDVVSAIQELVAKAGRPTLLLGVTPELARAFDSVIAVDHSPAMIRNLWDGDAPGRRAIQGDWREMASFGIEAGAAVGDGSLNALTCPESIGIVFRELAAVLAPGGRFVCHVYTCPDEGVRADDLMAAARNHDAIGFNGFKWLVAMAVATVQGHPNVAVADIRTLFDGLFADRGALAAATGWDRRLIDTIDAYAGSAEVYSFPTRSELLEVVPDGFRDARFVETAGYDLAELCPLLVVERAGGGA